MTSSSRVSRAFRRRFGKRRAQIYCVGPAKSGTHSIASIFEPFLRTAHEPEVHQVIRLVLDRSRGIVTEEELREVIRERDSRLRLEVDSSQLNYFILDALLQEFRDSRFILTLRDCYSWLDSLLNDHLNRTPHDPIWMEYRDLRHDPTRKHVLPEEAPLKERGLYTLDGYFSYWAKHYSEVLAKVPSDRLLVIRTTDITQKVAELLAFAGVSMAVARAGSSHECKAPRRHNVLSQIEPHFLEEKVRQHCGPLMRQHFPEIVSSQSMVKG